MRPSARLVVSAVSGYSGGGKGLIEVFEGGGAHEPWGAYAFALDHKHLPEMSKFAGIEHAPIFMPAVGAFAQGMVVSVPIHYDTDLEEGATGAVGESLRAARPPQPPTRTPTQTWTPTTNPDPDPDLDPNHQPEPHPPGLDPNPDSISNRSPSPNPGGGGESFHAARSHVPAHLARISHPRVSHPRISHASPTHLPRVSDASPTRLPRISHACPHACPPHPQYGR